MIVPFIIGTSAIHGGRVAMCLWQKLVPDIFCIHYIHAVQREALGVAGHQASV